MLDLRPVNTEHPLFERIWQAIKGWDIQRANGQGYAGASGTDVQIIIDAMTPTPAAESEAKDAGRYRWLRNEANFGCRVGPQVCMVDVRTDEFTLMHGKQVDDAVDAAMEGNNG